MELEDVKDYLNNKASAVLDFPFGKETYVYKVKGKMFALIGARAEEIFLNLKCDPAEASSLRDIFQAIKPGYHMDKRHWISVYLGEELDLPAGELQRLMDNSYALVVSKLSKKERASLALAKTDSGC